MKTVVVDCSVVVPWFFPEKGSEAALAIFDAFSKGHISCAAPALLQAEFGNMAWKKVSRKVCGAEYATHQIALFRKTEIKCCRCDEILPAAFTIACESRITVYDALYLAIAQALDAELATLDTTLAKAASACGITLAGDERL